MSTTSFRRQARARVDAAIHQYLAHLSISRGRRLAFENLVHQARIRSSLLRVSEHDNGDGSDPSRAVEALFNLSYCYREFRAWPGTWVGGDGDVYSLIHGFASHLLARYPVPRGFGTAWFGGASEAEQHERRWFIEHGAGLRLRALAGLPMTLTRTMERLILAGPPHLRPRAAMRRAEILALGGSPELVAAILRTRLATQADDGEFWRDVVRWAIEHERLLGPAQLAKLIEPLAELRSATRGLPGPEGEGLRLHGRTPASVERLLAGWRCDDPGVLGRIRWPSVGISPLEHHDEIGHWVLVELTDAAALAGEGAALRHCVAGYWRPCVDGTSSIWSLRLRQGDGRWASRCTLQLSPRLGAVVQIRGYANRRVHGRHRALIERWAAQVGVEVRGYAW